MVFLKISTLIVGIFSMHSANVSMTPMPSLEQCNSYLEWEYRDTSERSDRITLQRAEGILSMKLSAGFSTAHSTYECIEIK